MGCLAIRVDGLHHTGDAEKRGSNLRSGHTLPVPSSGRGGGRSPGTWVKEERRQRPRRPRPPEPVLLGGHRNPGETATQGLLSVGEVPLPLPPLGAPPLPQEEGAVFAGGLHALPVSDAPAERGEGQAKARVVPVRPEPPSTVLSYLLKHLPVSLGLGPALLQS